MVYDLFRNLTNLFQSDNSHFLFTLVLSVWRIVFRFSGATWSHFLSSSLCNEVINCFKDRNINAGIIIWRRHQVQCCFVKSKPIIFKVIKISCYVLQCAMGYQPPSKQLPCLSCQAYLKCANCPSPHF